MPSKLHGYRLQILVGCFLALLVFGETFAGDSRKPIHIRDLQVRAENGHLVLAFRADNLVSEKIKSTILSGLPAAVEFEIRLLRGKGEMIRKSYFRTLSYDIWSEKFSIQFEDTTEVFRSFEAMLTRISRCTDMLITPLNRLDRLSRYTLKLRATVLPVSFRQNQKLAGWLEASETSDDITSEERASGFKFNISRLISFFMGSRPDRGRTSKWFETTFTLSNVKK